MINSKYGFIEQNKNIDSGSFSFKKILFTTSYEHKAYDYIETNVSSDESPRLSFKRKMSNGLRFLQANVPGIEILEYPTWSEYIKAINIGWDILGFSFYTNEIPKIRKMISAARSAGITEIWGGNYGVLNIEIESIFDRVVKGYSEMEVAKWIGVTINKIVHPPLITLLELGKNLGLIPLGILFTLRGCNRGCTFCQTPAFCGSKLNPLPLDSIEEVLKTYQRLRVGALLILDECFGSMPEHAEKVVSLIDKTKLPWLPMTRADILMPRLSEWTSKGLAGALLGIENLHNVNLKTVKKGNDIEHVKELVYRLKANDQIVIGFYMIGFEDETPRSLRNDMQELAALELDIAQVCILTPFSQTALRRNLSKYGIEEKDLSKFDGKHLIWNHPNFQPNELESILQEFFRKAFPASRETETMKRFGRQLVNRVGFGAGLSYLIGSFFHTNLTISNTSIRRRA